MMHAWFDLEDIHAYQTWRAHKLSAYPLEPNKHIIQIQDAFNLSHDENLQLQTQCAQHNMVLYELLNQADDRAAVHALAKAVGLQHLNSNICADSDGLTALQVTQHQGQHDYIPYTNKQLSWHTDGYYNAPHEQIHGMLLHCVRQAQHGGESWLMDHEIAYILLRDTNPLLIEALMHPHAFTIPANVLNGETIRAEQTGPVFQFNTKGELHMRYSARQRNVIWRDDPITQEAATYLLALWENPSSYKMQYRLQAGQGVLCNNVLHCRTGFVDSEIPHLKRLLYRGRYYNRVFG